MVGPMTHGDYAYDSLLGRYGRVIAKASHGGIAWKLVMLDTEGREWSQWEMHCAPAAPPRSRPKLVTVNGVHV